MSKLHWLYSTNDFLENKFFKFKIASNSGKAKAFVLFTLVAGREEAVLFLQLSHTVLLPGKLVKLIAEASNIRL